MMTLRILLVDDNEGGLRALARLLRFKGHEVHAAATCHEALLIARERRCDLLISDITLPDGNGLHLMREIRQRYFIPGIVLTGHNEEAFIVESKAAGFGAYLLKPVHLADLMGTIDQVARSTIAAPSLSFGQPANGHPLAG